MRKNEVMGHSMTKNAAADETRGYHHGDLRGHLLRLAREHVASGGAETLSLSALARRAGVSQPAPYRHFASREALLEVIAEESFDALRQALEEAMAGKDAGQAIEALSLAYVRFGETNVHLYRLMFASRITPDAKAGGGLDTAANAALDVLRGALAHAAASADQAALERQVYSTWAKLHGLVMLKAHGFITGPLDAYVEVLG